MLTIGALSLPGAVVMAPMAGVGGAVFRQVAREQGACMVVTPLVSAEGLVRADAKSLIMATARPEEQPCAVQIFGDNPDVMAAAARILEARGARLIDINAGCPSKRILAGRAGVHLMRDRERLYAIAAAVVEAVSTPVTLKTRVGWSTHEVLLVPVVRAATRAGISAITVHARFKADGPAAPARWDLIRTAVQETDVPIVGNGGIRRAQDASAMVASTGCAGVMVGRAAVGRPWLLRQCQQALSGVPPEPDPSDEERLLVARRHIALQATLDPNGHDVHATAGVLSAYVRGFSHARLLRPLLLRASSYGELEQLLRHVAPTRLAEPRPGEGGSV
jgi:nifR3 family TIM-barrel protein